MLVYVSVRENVHTAPEVEVYTDRVKSVEETRRWAEESMRNPDVVMHLDCESDPNFECYLSHECESDFAFVKACEVDDVPAMQFQQTDDPFCAQVMDEDSWTLRK